MKPYERVKELRSALKLTQKEFGEKITLAQTYLSQIEKGDRDLTEKIFKLICAVYNVNEDWLRNGTGQMFVEIESFSLDDYARSRGASDLELDIIKGYLALDQEARNSLMNLFRSAFKKHDNDNLSKEALIEKELNNYRSELEAELKGETLSATLEPKENLG